MVLRSFALLNESVTVAVECTKREIGLYHFGQKRPLRKIPDLRAPLWYTEFSGVEWPRVNEQIRQR